MRSDPIDPNDEDAIDALIVEAEALIVSHSHARLARTHEGALPRIKKVASELSRADYTRHRDRLVVELDAHLRDGGDVDSFFTQWEKPK